MWRKWPKKKPLPVCIHVFASYDTAYTEREMKNASYSARTTWGVFEDESTGKYAMIMLEAWHGRVGYPQLRKEARIHYRESGCDRALIEKKASGQSLIQDMRQAKLDVMPFDPKRMDKVARANLASPMFDSGLVYYPDRIWAENVVDWVAAFPYGSPPSSDYTDTVTQAAIYVRRRRFMELPGDEEAQDDVGEDVTDEEKEDKPRGGGGAYG
jgi:predicted phage terminase large subunit-like protein